ncbi:MAG TPA: hypothetical protein VGP43_10065 [Chitinophagaceae bacterium]|nr:hypothetical protein [Chitinophagaceae bacterium]
MVEKELIQLINKQMDTDISVDSHMGVLKEKLIKFINDLIQNNFQKLIAILYKVDVDESKLKKLLREGIGKDTADIIATQIIEREIQKIETRKQFERK